MPKVSICIPVYNCEQYISKAIESVLNQTYKDFELIVINNKSTDKTLDIIKQYASDSRIRIVENENNIGFEGNWNKCLKEVKGEYIKILPADDLLMPFCLEEQVDKFEANKNLVLVTSTRNVIDSKDKVLMKRYCGYKKNYLTTGIDIIKKSIRRGTNIIGEPAAVLFKKEIVDKTDGFKGEFLYMIDFSLWVKILKYGNIFIIAKPCACFRVSDVSESVKIKNSQVKDFKRFVYLIKDEFELSFVDIYLGIFMAYINQTLRKIFYLLRRI